MEQIEQVFQSCFVMRASLFFFSLLPPPHYHLYSYSSLLFKYSSGQSCQTVIVSQWSSIGFYFVTESCSLLGAGQPQVVKSRSPPPPPPLPWDGGTACVPVINMPMSLTGFVAVALAYEPAIRMWNGKARVRGFSRMRHGPEGGKCRGHKLGFMKVWMQTVCHESVGSDRWIIFSCIFNFLFS